MNAVKIVNISLRTHDSYGRSHIEFVDGQGNNRLGYILPENTQVRYLDAVYDRIRGTKGIIIPDGITELKDGSLCLSVKSSGFSPLRETLTLSKLIKPLKALHDTGMNHLSIDEHCFVTGNTTVSLIFWGDGLLSVHRDAPSEVKAGGVPGVFSDLFMLASVAVKMNWIREPDDARDAKALFSNNLQTRLKTAVKYGYKFSTPKLPEAIEPAPGVSTVQGGSWQSRDIYVNQLTGIAERKGWLCRVIRCAAGERNRPLPDVPAGTFTGSPGDLLENTFAGKKGIEKLLIVQDLTADQADFVAILKQMARLIPSGLRMVICGASVPDVFQAEKLLLPGDTDSAVDVPLADIPAGITVSGTGPSWYGPRCRVTAEQSADTNRPFFSENTLFAEGAWRYTAALPGIKGNDSKAESLFILGRYSESLRCVSSSNHILKGKILIALGRFEEAARLLEGEDKPSLMAEACLGNGDVHRALEVLQNSSDPEILPMLAKLLDLTGSPASAFLPLKQKLKDATGAEKVNIYCALRNLEMRLGLYEDALEHAEAAVLLARGLTSISLLVKSLQERGRTLQNTGYWQEALEDYKTAVRFHDENMLSFSRPPHTDLYVMQLKMGRIREAGETHTRLAKLLKTGGKLSSQMLNMLEAYRGVLLGGGEKSLPSALKAASEAHLYGLELYYGLSTLYAGQLYIQSGDISRGTDLLNEARSRGHVLGDRHLVCLAEIELLLQQDCPDLSESRISEITVGLPEELAVLQIISGEEREKGFEVLLDMPSPLLACRLADKCGQPDSPVYRKSLLKYREDILSQLTPEEKQDYSNLFSSVWHSASDESFKPQNFPEETLRTVSRWIQNYLEGESDLPDLTTALNLEEISSVPGPAASKVPGAVPLYCSGSLAADIAPFLEPVAAVITAVPFSGKPAPEKDRLSLEIAGESDRIKSIRTEIKKAAPEDAAVFITGETGTGKELCARAIHSRSGRKHGSFVPVDCGAIPEALMESEFFGAARGAYTGVNYSRKGLLEEADGGTLFLDEIGNLPLLMQAKLLRVLDSGVFRRLGETIERKTDFRLVTATNANIAEQLAKGSFRTDLYYRISVIRISLPPLRDRLEDIPLLIPLFTSKKISGGALQLLSSYRWPGNIRELSNVMKRASIAARGDTVRRSHIVLGDIYPDDSETLTLHEAIKRHIRHTVESFGGSRSKAAKALKCDPKTLRKYLSEDDRNNTEN